MIAPTILPPTNATATADELLDLRCYDAVSDSAEDTCSQSDQHRHSRVGDVACGTDSNAACKRCVGDIFDVHLAADKF